MPDIGDAYVPHSSVFKDYSMYEKHGLKCSYLFLLVSHHVLLSIFTLISCSIVLSLSMFTDLAKAIPEFSILNQINLPGNVTSF